MMICGKYKIGKQYLLQITNEKEYCIAISDYAINGLLMKCCMETNDLSHK